MLTENNYRDWLSSMTSYLRVIERYVDPETAFARLDDLKKPIAVGAWDIINLHCDSTNKGLIANTKNSTDAFAALKKRYADTSLVNKMGLYFDAFHTPLGKDESMSVYVGRKRAAIAQLESMDEKLSDAAQVTTLLHNLPKSYDSIVTSVMSFDEKKLNFAKISQLLLNEETRMKSQSTEPDTAARASTSRGSSWKVPRCRYEPCMKRGHTEDKCRLKQENEKKNKAKSRSKATENESESEHESVSQDEQEQASFCFYATRAADSAVNPPARRRAKKPLQRASIVPKARPSRVHQPSRCRLRSSSCVPARRQARHNILDFPRNADLRSLINASKKKPAPLSTHQQQQLTVCNERKPSRSTKSNKAMPNYDADILELHVNNDELSFDDELNNRLKASRIY